MRYIAITGGSGFIGGKLVKELISKSDRIKCLVRNTSNTDGLINDKLELVTGDMENRESLTKLTEGCDTVFHLAAFVSDWGKRDDFININYKATRDLLDGSVRNGVKKFVYLSTSSVVWRSDFRNIHKLADIDETYPYPISYNDYYNESKAMAEKLVIEFNGRQGMNTVVIRPSGVWGAGDKVILPRILRAAVKGFLIPAGDGSGMVSPCHVQNLVRALYLASVSDKSSGKIYFINDGFNINHVSFIKKLLSAAGLEWNPGFHLPYKIAYSLAYFIEQFHKMFGINKPPIITRFAVSAIAGSRTYSITNAKDDLNYTPVLELDSGLEELIKWVNEIGGYQKLMQEIKFN